MKVEGLKLTFKLLGRHAMTKLFNHSLTLSSLSDPSIQSLSAWTSKFRSSKSEPPLWWKERFWKTLVPGKAKKFSDHLLWNEPSNEAVASFLSIRVLISDLPRFCQSQFCLEVPRCYKKSDKNSSATPKCNWCIIAIRDVNGRFGRSS